MASKKKGQADASKFEGNGMSFKAKLIGVEEVPEARGDLLCQDAITRLKNAVKASGQHKQKIFINVTLEGLKVIDAISLLVLHTHPVHKISFISRDTTDNRAFGYIIGSGEGKHTFYAIKTAAAAEQLVLTLRDLFQVVYELKKKQVEEAKVKMDGDRGESLTENETPSGEGSISEAGQTQMEIAPAANGDGIYNVPPNNAPVNGSLEEQQANLLELEDQADTILKGIEQIKNLEFDSLTSDGDMLPMSPAPQDKGSADPWAVPTSTPAATVPATSALGDLAGIQTNMFGNIAQQPFPGSVFPAQTQTANFNMPEAQAYNIANTGLPVAQDPFGSDPFNAVIRLPNVLTGVPAPSYAAANPFGSGMASIPPARFPASNQNPFSTNTPEDPNIMKPIRPNQRGEEEANDPKSPKKAPKEDPFGDLLGISKSTSDAKTPRDMFAQLNMQDKKPMNQLMAGKGMQSKINNASPFGDSFAP